MRGSLMGACKTLFRDIDPLLILTIDVPLLTEEPFVAERVSIKRTQRLKPKLWRTVVSRLLALVIASPGAKISTTDPKFEKSARTSLMVEAPTVMAVGARAGLEFLAS